MKAAKKPKYTRFAETLGQAAAILQDRGIRVTAKMLGEARKAGLPGFRGPRVHIDELIPALGPWLKLKEGKGPETKDALTCRRLRLQCERLAFENEQAQDKWLPAALVNSFMRAKHHRMCAMLQQIFRNELPPKLEGLKAAQIAVKLDECIPRIMEDLRTLKSS